jgi:hypothetical protein
MIDFTCPDCGTRKAYPNSEAGQITRCPGCNGYIKLPPLGCELPVARGMGAEFYLQSALFALMVLAWAVPLTLALTPETVSWLLPLFAVVVSLGTLFVGVVLPWHRRSLPARFLQLGRLTGKTQREIVVVAGEPTAWTEWDEETELLEWRANQYYLALVFRNEVCQGVQQEARVDMRQAL